jgi:hypothetical protein
VKRPCSSGWICRKDGVCEDPCLGKDCPSGSTCIAGTCVDCYRTGCAPGERCIARRCSPDPCKGVACGAGSFCREGLCVPSCGTVLCPAGESCSQGRCLPDACRGACLPSEICHPTSGRCESSQCASIACPSGQVCLESTSMCVFNPCEKVQCPPRQLCRVGFAGETDCVAEVKTSTVVASSNGKGGGGMGCEIRGQATVGAGAPTRGLLFFAFLAMALRRISARRRR